MEATDLYALLTARPFRPFRVKTTRAMNILVSSPSAALVSTSKLYIAPDAKDGEIPDKVLEVPIAQIASAEIEG